MKKYKNVLLFLGIFIFFFFINYYNVCNNDLVWNYGFSYNFAKGLKMYTDYSMVITPLYPTIFGIIMKIFGTNIIVFYLANALIPTAIVYIVYKYYKKVTIEMLLLIAFISMPNYNLLCMLLLFILFVLEDKKCNDYLIGIILGLAFLTKSPMILLSLASLYYIKNIKKIFKRIIGFLIPHLIYIIYFYFTGSLFNYFNYAFGSLIDFATKNVRSTLGIAVFIFSILLIIFLYFIKKYKDIKLLYILAFQIMSYPIFNYMHIAYSAVPLLFYLCLKINKPLILKYKKYLAIFLIAPLAATILMIFFKEYVNGTNALSGKLIERKYLNDAKKLHDNLNGFENTYFVIYEAYFYKLLYNNTLNKYDLLLNGNMGYKGSDNVINYFKNTKKGTKFVVYGNSEGGQVPTEIVEYIKNHYNLCQIIEEYEIYVKD